MSNLMTIKISCSIHGDTGQRIVAECLALAELISHGEMLKLNGEGDILSLETYLSLPSS